MKIYIAIKTIILPINDDVGVACSGGTFIKSFAISAASDIYIINEYNLFFKKSYYNLLV